MKKQIRYPTITELKVLRFKNNEYGRDIASVFFKAKPTNKFAYIQLEEIYSKRHYDKLFELSFADWLEVAFESDLIYEDWEDIMYVRENTGSYE